MIKFVGGICAARNTGLSLVDTEYMSSLDDDDRLLPGAYAPLLEALNGQNAVAVGTVLVERGGKLIGRRISPSSMVGQLWGLDRALLNRRGVSFACKQSALYPTTLLREAGGWNEALRSRGQTELFFRLCARYPFIGVDHPVYALSRSASDHSIGDPELRQAGYQYLLETYDQLLSDPERFRYFQRNHAQNLRRSSALGRICKRLEQVLNRLKMGLID